MNKFTINKLGFVDFWYYDVQEFDLSDGRLLLRGSNGSGKSVTMQSFIPLVLDGNKAPSRLDPSGSNDKRIENYMLDEMRNERTSYLYIEFKNNDTYVTIGMGLKAEKNKSLDSWYFIIDDGRRINKDLFLYEGSTERIALTKTKLQNRVLPSGFFTTKQGEYMRKVNELIFGYDNLEGYEELLKLLIKVRAPKISKDFKPSMLYDILKDSLNILSDEDLRPISESMQNMDDLRRRQLLLGVAIKAANILQKKYDAYNKKILLVKAEALNSSLMELDKIKNLLHRQINGNLKKEEELSEITAQHQEKILQLQSAEIKLADYAGSELGRVVTEAESIRTNIAGMEQELIGIKKNIDDLDTRLKKFLKGKKDYEAQIYILNDNVDKYIEQANEYAIDTSFAYWNEITSVKLKDMQKNNTISFYLNALEDYENQILNGIPAIKTRDEVKARISKLENEEYEMRSEKELIEKDLERMDEMFNDCRSELKISFDKWNDSNKLFNLDTNEKIALFKKINEINEARELTSLAEMLHVFFTNIDQKIREKHIDAKKNEESIAKEIDNTKKILRELETAQELAPPRRKSAIKLREEMAKRKIPYTPFYKAFDFADELNDDIKNVLESAFNEMGLIDALIVDSKYRDIIFGMMNEFKVGDKFIFCDDKDFADVAKAYLIPENDATIDADIFRKLISNLISNSSASFVNTDGYYHHGIVAGKADWDYTAKYVGENSRQNFRKAKILEIKEKLNHLEPELQTAQKITAGIESDISLLKTEYKNAPSYRDIETAINEIDNLLRKLGPVNKELEQLSESIFSEKQAYEKAKAHITDVCKDISLEKTLPVFEEALSCLKSFIKLFHNIKGDINSWIHTEENLFNATENIENINYQLEDSRYKLSKFERTLDEQKNILRSKEAFIRESQTDEIKEEIQRCAHIKNVFPEEISKLREKMGTIKNEISSLINSIKEKQAEQQVKEIEAEVRRKEFIAEAQNEFVIPFQDSDVDKFCKNIKLTYENECALGTDYYFTQLTQAYHENTAQLRENSVQLLSKSIEYASENTFGFSTRSFLTCYIDGKQVPFSNLPGLLKAEFDEIEAMIRESERNIFENILFNSISIKIRSKVKQSRLWVNKINSIMAAKGKTQRLELFLKWEPKSAETEDEMHINKIMEILEDDKKVSNDSIQNLSKHFNSKIKSKIREIEDKQEHPNYQLIVREILDYRQWFEFKLFMNKDNEGRKELTLRNFNQLSVGERAMAMYIPMFAAVNARYDKASKKCARIVCMDEAFAGISDNNKRILFTLLKDMELEYILNSQELWGTYSEVDSLNIYELYREPSDRCVGILRYHWDGARKTYVE